MRISENIQGLHHIGLPSKTPADTIAFLQKLGFGKIYMHHVVYLQRGDLTLEVYPLQDDVPRCPNGLYNALGITVTDLLESARLVGFSSEVTSQMLPTGQLLHSVTGAGPDGIQVRLIQPSNGTFPCFCDYIQARVCNLTHATAYFEELGFDSLFFMNEVIDGNTQDVVYLQMDSWNLKLVQQQAATTVDSHIDHFALSVKDVDAAYNTAASFQCPIVEDSPRFLPIWQHGTRFFTVRNSEGHKIEFMQMITH